MVKRLLSSLMALCLVMTLLPSAALAAEGNVAKIGDVEYATLQYAVNAVPTDGTPTTIELIANVDGGTLAPSDTVVTVATVAAGQNIKLDLAGHTISAALNTNGNNYAKAHVLLNNGTLTVTDSSADHSGAIVNTNKNSYACTRTIKNAEGATLNINSGTITANSGVALLNLGICHISGDATVVQALQEGYSGGWTNAVAGIENRTNGQLTVSGGAISSASQSALYTDGGSATITGGTFTGNAAYGAMNGSPDQYVTVEGGRFSSDPSACINELTHVVQLEDNYYLVSVTTPSDVTVNTADELVAALSGSNSAIITLGSDLTLAASTTVPSYMKLVIPQGITLSLSDEAILTLNGTLENHGAISVGAHAFLSGLKRISGSGSLNMPKVSNGIYTVSSPMDLQWLSLLFADENHGIRSVVLNNDISIPAGAVFENLGEVENLTFDGQGHTISGLTIRGIGGYDGLFIWLGDSIVKDLTLADCDYVTQSGFIGGVVGQANGTTFSNVTVSGSISASATSYGVGGIAGSVYSSAGTTTEFINCTVNANVGGQYSYNVGSIFGTAESSVGNIGVYNCSNTGTITAAGSVGQVFGYGGISNTSKVEIIGFSNHTSDEATNKLTLLGAASSGDKYVTTYADGSQYIAVKDENGQWETVSAETKVVASINGAPFASLSDAISAAQDGDTIVLLSDISNSDMSKALNFSINKDIILDGNGHSISGNTALYVGASNQNTTLQNIHFENIHNSTSKLSPVYATGLSGNLTITGCTFVNCDWDAIQATPVAGANIVIQNNYFEITDDAPVKGQRFVHVQSSTNTDFSITVTGNKMLGDTVQEAMGVYYPTDRSKMNLSGNYINSSTPLCILTGSGINSAELAYPMANEDMSINTSAAVLVKDAYYVTAYETLDAALANGAGKTVVLAQNISVNKELSIPDTLTFDANGKTITLEAGGKLTSYLDLSGTVTAASGYQLSTSGTEEDGYTYTVYQVSSGGGSSSSGNKTETVTNPDGSTTTTVTRPDGSKTETTKNPDGSTEVVDTKKDGTVTTTTTDKTGNKTEVVENTDGTSQTTVTNKDGSSSTTKVDKTGKAESQVKLPAAVVNAATEKGEAVALPMPAVPAVSNKDSASSVTVTLPSDTAAKVEIPVENVTAGTVAVRMLPDGTEEILMDSVVTENGVAVTLKTGDTVKIVDNSEDFMDVPDSHWGVDAVDFVTSRELFNGTSATTFTPAGDMTRAMVLTVLARCEGEDTTTGDTWYEAGVAWAMENGISDGTNPMASVTREQLALMLYRYVGSPAVSSSLNSFPDAADVSDWAVQGMTWAVENGLITGTGAGELNPQGTASRVEVATMFMRFIENQNK